LNLSLSSQLAQDVKVTLLKVDLQFCRSYNVLIISFSDCQAVVDLGFIVDYSQSVADGHSDEEHFWDIRDFIIGISTTFNISDQYSHFAYIPFGTYAADLPSQWFNNSDLKMVPSNNKEAQKEHLMKVIQPLPPNSEYATGKIYFLNSP
jgi:hypothetical protein